MGIDKQLEFVKSNKAVLNQKYEGRYVVISEQLEINPFDTLDEAYLFGSNTYGLGNFLLQQFSAINNQVQIINQTIIVL